MFWRRPWTTGPFGPVGPVDVPPGLRGFPYAGGITRKQEVEMLKDQAVYFGDILSDIEDRIAELEAKMVSEEKHT